MERHEIIELMGQLKLAGMRAAYDKVITAGLRAQHSVQRIIGELLLAQLADNRARSTAYRLGVARFPVMKNLAEFDFSVSPVNQGLVRELHEGGFLATQRNAVLIGGTGTGKSHVSPFSGPRGACHWGRSLAPRPCIRLDPCGPDHEAVIRFEGEAPSWWAHSADGVIARLCAGFTATSDQRRRVRERLIAQRTQTINMLRGQMAEFGMVAAKGPQHVKELVAELVEPQSVPEPLRQVLSGLVRLLTALREQIAALDKQILAWHRANPCSRRLSAVDALVRS